MIVDDYSPHSSPSVDQQRDALQKGLGRALQWALRGRLQDELLLEACLHDQRFDAQVEPSRADWLWEIITASGTSGRFRVPVLHALYEAADDWSTVQLCGLGRRYAEAGDEAFRSCLYEIVERKPHSRMPWLGEQDLIQLEGEQGFLFAARVRGRELPNREWDQWDEGDLIDHAIKRFGNERVRSLLANAHDEDISRFEQAWRRAEQPKSADSACTSHEARRRDIRVDEILAIAQRSFRTFGPFRAWGRFAEKLDLLAVFDHLVAETNPVVIANLLKTFSVRPLPEVNSRIIGFCSHQDDSVRLWAYAALALTEHSLVADFARSQLEQGLTSIRALSLFIKNYSPGDERRILQVLELPAADWERHVLLMDVIRMLENNAAAVCSRLALLAYFATPCANCRRDAARLLHKQRVAPEWLAAECQFDSSEECRALAAQVLQAAELAGGHAH